MLMHEQNSGDANNGMRALPLEDCQGLVAGLKMLGKRALETCLGMD